MNSGESQANMTPETMSKVLWVLNFVMTLVRFVRKGVSLLTGLRKKKVASSTESPEEDLSKPTAEQ